MKIPNIIILIIIVIIILAIPAFFYFKNSSQHSTIVPSLPEPSETNMKITSVAFSKNQLISPKYTCDGSNINPPLQFSDVPNNAKSLVLIVDDPDAPVGNWVHWLVFNIPQNINQIDEGASPFGIEGITSFGKAGYGGPCPPSGTHRYFFKLYALDTLLSLTNRADKKSVEAAMKDHILAQAELTGLYSRK